MSFKLGAVGVGVAALALVASQGFYTVNDGERGVVVTLGKVVGVAEPGTNWKIPFITNVVNFSVRDHVARFDNLEAYTRDQQTATVTATSVNYRVEPGDVEQVYKEFGTVENLVNQAITRRINENLEVVFGQYNALRAVQERSKLINDVGTLVKATNLPITITSVQVEGISYSDEYEDNVAEQMKAEVEVRRLEEVERQAEVTARTTVINAQAQADARLATARAEAEAIRIKAQAEADGIKARGDALRENPTLVDLTKAERWDGVLPTTVLPNGTLPFIDVAPTTTVPVQGQ